MIPPVILLAESWATKYVRKRPSEFQRIQVSSHLYDSSERQLSPKDGFKKIIVY